MLAKDKNLYHGVHGVAFGRNPNLSLQRSDRMWTILPF